MTALSWYWHRLKAMDASEVIGRVREKTLRHTERRALSELGGIVLHNPPQNAPALPDPQQASAGVRQCLAAETAKLVAGQWTLYGWREVSFALPPQWHRDYVQNVDAPASGSTNHRSLSGGADVRTIWEINRWSEMVRVSMHGHVSGDLAAIAAAQGWLEDWAEHNPVGQGVNWTSALEAGLRLINFCWFDALVRHTVPANLLSRQEALAQRIVPAHVWWVQRYLSFGSSANNHRLGELTGLLLAVKRWPELESVAGTAADLWKEVSHSFLSQFEEDGGSREQALHYHLFAMEMALHACRAMGATAGPVMERLQKAADFFVHAAHPEEPWDYGDSDDAQIVPLTSHRSQAVAEWRHYLAGTAPHGSLAFWLGCPPAKVAPSLPAASWWVAPQSGMAVCEKLEWKLRLDASPLGFGKLAAHGHCDALHVSIWDGPHALIIDPGTGGYYGMQEQRCELASWAAHNGPQPVAAFNAPQRMGAFLWADHHDCPVISQETSNTVTASLQHEGQHLQRRIEVDDRGIIQIIDSVRSGASLRVRWYLTPECAVTSTAPDSYHITRAGKIWSISLSGSQLACRITEGLTSPHYGEFRSCPVLEVTAAGEIKTSFQRILLSPDS